MKGVDFALDILARTCFWIFKQSDPEKDIRTGPWSALSRRWEGAKKQSFFFPRFEHSSQGVGLLFVGQKTKERKRGMPLFLLLVICLFMCKNVKLVLFW